MYHFKSANIILNGEKVKLVPKSLPGNPEQGYLCLDSSDGKFKYYNGTKWIFLQPIKIQKDDANDIEDVYTLNFEGNVTVTDEGDGKVTINIPEGSSSDISNKIFSRTFNHTGSVGNTWLYYELHPSSDAGCPLAYDCKIVGLSWQNDASTRDIDWEIYKNGVKQYTWEVRDKKWGTKTNLPDITFSKGDLISIYGKRITPSQKPRKVVFEVDFIITSSETGETSGNS